MSTENKYYTLKFKDAAGNWIELPMLYSDIYDMYVKYCEENDVDAVSMDTYYATLGQLQALVTDFGTSTEAVRDLIDALEGGNLPLSKGGLGAKINSAAAPGEYANFNAYVYGNTDLDAKHRTLQRDIDQKLYSSAINYGAAAPTSNTPGTYYFQYE